MSNISAMDDGGENNIRRAGGTTRSAQMAAPGDVMPRCRLISAGHLRSGPSLQAGESSIAPSPEGPPCRIWQPSVPASEI